MVVLFLTKIASLRWKTPVISDDFVISLDTDT